MRAGGIFGLALLGWASVLVAVTILFEPSPRVLVMGSGDDIARLITAEDGIVLSTTGPVAQAVFPRSGFVQRLYGAGVWLVLPAPDGGTCFAPARS